MGAESRQPCPTCGLWDPCKTCGGGDSQKPKLAAVAAGYTRDEVIALMVKAWNLGAHHMSLSDEAQYPAKEQRKIDIDQILSGAL